MPLPLDIKLQQTSRKILISFDSGEDFEYSCEFLRVYSQSAEVTGHAPGQEVLQVGKQDVGIDNISPVGNYAIRLHFNDGHDSGIYTWERLYDLGINYQAYWVDYLRRLMRAGHSHPALSQLQKESGK
ncbi:gamma-butyrobetaine hydroxylase-like domain-containing protein [Thiomicrospira microaerophila]|uniref:gamma-butyrobetaine hydroxylase-like domain-containing protein n=1 Tax=Thiomicrospira microaerophila TaxID=406020 RepID=UPI0005C80BFB|nr:DUF971 domain-containing protein [Thiomicrospira microaerophila]